MNERLQELSQLAWTKTSEAVPFYDSTGNISRDFNLKYQQEFAELIVRQMLDITDAHTEVFRSDRDKALVEHIKQSVKTHFGVEK